MAKTKPPATPPPTQGKLVTLGNDSNRKQIAGAPRVTRVAPVARPKKR